MQQFSVSQPELNYSAKIGQNESHQLAHILFLSLHRSRNKKGFLKKTKYS